MSDASKARQAADELARREQAERERVDAEQADLVEQAAARERIERDARNKP